ncbi:MAG: DNA polymerase III subunit delta' [Syntrophaceae bacterium]|nr:DNA polymerase III subunit delta' [Syntrophaceae bacterium]
MPFARIKGQEKAIAALRKALGNDRLAHAYLFVGPEGVGKRLTALTLAKAMNCQSPPEPGDCCEKCPPCIKANSSNHADIITVEPEGEFIKIDQVREMQKRLRFRPMEGGRRACIIDPAERMKAEASNALLKILEEPPRDTHLFLITGRPHQLLSTILSRCQWIRFHPLSPPDIAQILEKNRGLEEEKARFYASLAGGSVGQAMALSERVDFQKRVEWLQFFSHLPQKSAEEVFETCERLAKEEEDIQDLLDLWKIWVRDLTVFKVQGNRAKEGLINHDLLAVLEKDAPKVSFDRLEGMFRLISEVQSSLAYNVNKQLALETLMLDIRKENSIRF